MDAPVFTYGTLEFAEVVRFVTGRDFAGEPGVLRGHARYGLTDVRYPGLVPEAGASTEGTLYRGVDPPTLVRLDEYESSLYERRWVSVETASGAVSAWVWVVRATFRDRLSAEPWSRDDFARQHLDGFLREIGAR